MAEKLTYILFQIPGLTIIIAAIILILRGKCSPRIKKSMSTMLIVVAISMLSYAQFYNQSLVARYSWGFDFLYCLITPFCAPLYYLAINCLTDIKRRQALNVAMFLPAIIYAVLLISAQGLLNSEERHAYICNEILGQNIQTEASVAYTWMVLVAKKIFAVFMPAQGILVMIYGEFRLNTYTRMLEDYSTNYTPGKSIKMRGIHVLTILVVVTGLVMSSIPIPESSDHILLVSIAVVGQVVMVSLIVSYVMKLEYSAEEMKEIINEPVVPVQPVVRPRQMDGYPGAAPVTAVRKEEHAPSTLIEKIDYAMRNDNLFLQADLSLVTLCEKVGTNRTYASKAIKDAKGCNFSDYVNRFRLEYAVGLMKNTPKDDIVIQNIAMQCGCGSIQTFYRYFKLFYNETPTQWIERNK
ncbi:MAG: helix-turn-helix transcriptional regulator [Bacteroidaceae bacterium]|nr:helix-turn-helix transcriptional regulator [Bacteroidaceae bacterium]